MASKRTASLALNVLFFFLVSACGSCPSPNPTQNQNQSPPLPHPPQANSPEIPFN
ncbi:hypothetical protein E1A91_D08G219600v1 [Gossypium mustelinum]|uniref:Uncharacterized protein n=1 Tax=Gossypium mustelinum TaxID=34275 RepID=A0A5D2U1H5_GOSMU|nr:hypothetical protein E1A91_D08G219600v1 [Gossypium mustelinum]